MLQKSSDHPIQKLTPSFNIEIAAIEADIVNQLDKVKKNCPTDKCPLFLRIKSSVKTKCDFTLLNCSYEDSNKKFNFDDTILESLKSNWTIYAIYDFDINNSNYNLTEFKVSKNNEHQKNMSSFLFNDPRFVSLIKKDIDAFDKKFEYLVFGSDINLLFAQISNESNLKTAVDAFWKTLFEIKDDSQNIKISTGLNYEHMRGTNYWGPINRDSLKKLDFVSFSSTPLSTRWNEYSHFFSQLYLYTEDKTDLLDNYYDGLTEFEDIKQPIQLIEFRFPLESNDPFKLRAFFELSNFFTYFNHAPFPVSHRQTNSSYLKKTEFGSIKALNHMKNSL